MRIAAIFVVMIVLGSVGVTQAHNESASAGEKIVDNGTSPYAPTRTSLYMARSAGDEDWSAWEFGHDILGEFFPIVIRGVFDSVQISEANELLGIKGNHAKVIGMVAEEVRQASGEMAYPVLERTITLNDDTKVYFQLIEKGRSRFWVAIFE